MDKNILEDVVRRAKKNGADDIDILVTESKTVSVSSRLTRVENVTVANEADIQVRALVGKRSAIITADNVNKLQDNDFIDQAISAARNAPEEDEILRPDVQELYHSYVEPFDNDCFSQLSLDDVSLDRIKSEATACEKVAFMFDGVTNTDGANIYRSKTAATVVRGTDFCKSYIKNYNQMSCTAITEKDGELYQGYACSKAVDYEDLAFFDNLAAIAVFRAVSKRGSKKIKSCKVPVIFDREVARQIIGGLINTLNGDLVAKKISFLSDKLGAQIFGNLNITNQPNLKEGISSRPFDSEGMECTLKTLISEGRPHSFLLNTKYANQLGMKSTASALGFNGVAPENIFVKHSDKTMGDMMQGIKNGLYVTEVMGNGINVVTGDYSQGASGYWVENGEVVHPVHEITLAGNLCDMLSHCEVANDIYVDDSIITGSLFIEQMVVGGI